MEHKDCPKELLESNQKNFAEITPYKAIVVFKTNTGGSAVIVSGDDDLKFGLTNNFTYHELDDLEVSIISEGEVLTTCRLGGIDRVSKINLLIEGDVITVGLKDIF